MSDCKYTAFRCPVEILELVKIKAKKDRHSLSNFIITLLAKEVEGMVLPVAAAKKATVPKPAKKVLL